MNERAKIIAEQALSLPADEKKSCSLRCAGLGRDPFERLEEEDAALSDEYRQYLKEAWEKGVASGPGRCASIEDIVGEARRRFGDRSWSMRRVAPAQRKQ